MRTIMCLAGAIIAAIFISCGTASAQQCKVDSTVPTLASGDKTPLRCTVNGELIVTGGGGGGGGAITAPLGTATAPSAAVSTVIVGGILPAFAATPTVNLGTLGGAAIAANQTTEVARLDSILSSVQGPVPAGEAIIGKTVSLITNPTSTTTRPATTVAPSTTAVTCVSPSVFTISGLALVNGQTVQLGAVPCTGAQFATGTVYYVVGVSGNNFSLAATRGGAAINGSGTATSVITVTTVYAPTDLISTSATAGSATPPSITVARLAAGNFFIPRLTLRTNVTTGWEGAALQVNLWRAAPTYSFGDASPYAVATGSANKLGSFLCTLAQYGDGAAGECEPTVGSGVGAALASGQVIYGDIFNAGVASLVPIASQTFTITADDWQN